MIEMNKVLFDVFLPATGKHYDFWVPANARMQVVTELIAQAMQVAESDYYCASRMSALMYTPTGQIQEPSATVAEIGFTNGDSFVLV